MNIAVHPTGRYAAVLHAGYSQNEVIVLELSGDNATIRSRSTLDATFYGLAWSPAGDRLFCSGGPRECIEEFTFSDGQLGQRRRLPVFPAQTTTQETAWTCVPAGLAVSNDGTLLYAAGNRGHDLVMLLVGPPVSGTPGSASATSPALPPLHIKLPEHSFPYGCVLDEQHQRVYVSLWGQARVAVFNLPLVPDAHPLAYWPTEDHPNEMLLTRDSTTLYVANANRNTVSAIDTATGRPREVLCSALFPNAPNGSTPNAIALSPDERTLYIANADNNNLAVMDVSEPARAKPRGFIPVGWYPTSVRVTPDGQHLLVANGKGVASRANRYGPNPLRRAVTVDEYIASLFRGTLSVIKTPDAGALANLSATAYGCSPLRGDLQPSAARPPDNPIPAKVGDPAPLRYVFYIIKENRTYDQVFGDIPEGHGDPSLCIFGADVTPNLHALVREFVLLDNFYVESEVSADGHEWSMAAYATDFVEKNWPLEYGGKSFGKIGYPSEGAFAIAAPSAGYIWDACAAAGLSYYSFGEFMERAGDQIVPKVAALRGHSDPQYEPFNLDVPDQQRADRFIAELARWEREGQLPRFTVVHLPGDHTAGTSAGKRTPTAMVADNDLALGRMVAALSRSKYWPQTAIFVVEDDAQNGPDHIDAHRTTALVISPYVRRHTVDSSLYSTTSMLRTIELTLGLPPMSQFDAAARPMYASFGPTADLRPYVCLPATTDLSATNSPLAWGAERSAQFDFSTPDAADDLELNDIVWRSVRGADTPMPTPVRAAFVWQAPDQRQGEELED